MRAQPAFLNKAAFASAPFLWPYLGSAPFVTQDMRVLMHFLTLQDKTGCLLSVQTDVQIHTGSKMMINGGICGGSRGTSVFNEIIKMFDHRHCFSLLRLITWRAEFMPGPALHKAATTFK